MPQGDPRLRGDDMGQKRGGCFPLPFSMDPIPYRYTPGRQRDPRLRGDDKMVAGMTSRGNRSIMKRAFFAPV